MMEFERESSIVLLILVVSSELLCLGGANTANVIRVDQDEQNIAKHISKRQAVAVPTATCGSKKEGHVYPVPAHGDLVWICRSGEWLPFRLLPSLGSASSSPAKSCKHIRDTVANSCSLPPQSGLYWGVKVTDPCSGDEQTMQVYCDMTISSGGWSLVWKHSYMEVSSITSDMFYHSSYYKPCTNLNTGWCNVPGKIRFMPEEMMIAAYHNGRLVYAYKGTFNLNIDHNWPGATLLPPVAAVVDHCTRSGIKIPAPKGPGLHAGLAFTRGVDGGINTDTIRLTYVSDERWEECLLPSSFSSSAYNVQMTVAIYVR